VHFWKRSVPNSYGPNDNRPAEYSPRSAECSAMCRGTFREGGRTLRGCRGTFRASREVFALAVPTFRGPISARRSPGREGEWADGVHPTTGTARRVLASLQCHRASRGHPSAFRRADGVKRGDGPAFVAPSAKTAGESLALLRHVTLDPRPTRHGAPPPSHQS
jgi:hypothetical protein